MSAKDNQRRELREALHQFAITYRVESRETRNEDIDAVLTEVDTYVATRERELRISTIGQCIETLAFESIPLSDKQFESLKNWQQQLEAQERLSTPQKQSNPRTGEESDE